MLCVQPWTALKLKQSARGRPKMASCSPSPAVLKTAKARLRQKGGPRDSRSYDWRHYARIRCSRQMAGAVRTRDKEGA